MEQQLDHEKPLTFGQVLDVSFRTIKENFLRLFQIMLIFMGPIYVLQGIGMLSGGVSLLREPNRGMGIMSFLESLSQSGMQGASPNLGTTYFVLLIVSSLMLCIISVPMAYASLIIAIKQIRKKESVNLLSIIKQAFSRFWALLGGNMVYGLLYFALFIGMVLIITLYLVIAGGVGVFQGLAAGTTAGLGIHILVIILIALSAFLGTIYLLTRWSYFFAAIVFEKVSPGLRKSWKLTRGCFWRLVGLYLVVILLNVIFAVVIQMAVTLFLGNSILAFLLNSLVSILITMIPVIVYAVIYFDLQVRNEAVDLKEMLETYQSNTILSNREVAIGQSTTARQDDDQLPKET
ncbi:MAG: hypothetical protein ACYDEJ_10800 [Desulfitobacteriaceae bacterium]